MVKVSFESDKSKIFFYKNILDFSVYMIAKFFAIILNISIRIFYNKFRYNSI